MRSGKQMVLMLTLLGPTFMLSATPVVAADAPNSIIGPVGDGVEYSRAVVKHHSLVLSDGFLERAHEHPEIEKFCRRFIEDLKAERVEYVKPVLVTTDPNHPELQRYHTCQEYAHTGEQLSKRDYVYRDLSKIGTTNFRLYRLDLDGNPANGAEELLYGEQEVSPIKKPAYKGPMVLLGTHAQVDLKQCMLTYQKPTVLNSEPGGRKTGETALIRYRNTPYIVQLSESGKKFTWDTDYFGELWGHADFGPGLNNTRRCAFEARRKEE